MKQGEIIRNEKTRLPIKADLSRQLNVSHEPYADAKVTKRFFR